MSYSKILIFLIIYCNGCFVKRGEVEGLNVRWCALQRKEKQKCDVWAGRSNTDMSGSNNLTCVSGLSHRDCYAKIANGEADLASFDGGDIYHGGKLLGLKVIMAEQSSGSPTNTSSYYAVAVVKNGTTWTLSNLKGAKSCHTGVAKTSGWNVPIGYLLEKKIMKWKSCDVFKSVASFFTASCAPGANDVHYNPKKTQGGKLCSLCIGDGVGSHKCARRATESYYGYKGALRCLEDDRGDVAFIKQSTLTSLSPSDKAKYKLLCKDNTQKDPDMYERCNLALVPGHAIMTSKSKTASEITQYQEFLENADTLYGAGAHAPFKLYTKENLLFSGSTIKLFRIPIAKQPYDIYLPRSYIDTITGLKSCKDATGKGTLRIPSNYMSCGAVVVVALMLLVYPIILVK